ncbi:response regulator [Desulforamulus hydrothermalis]|uniref:Stage 0 sporulation protein A homolog n=1 Tax=Desulforamulus hydrothermalis Lam5 = DSM 18033 TaxID=1121428 RepID=K8DZZ5_9FIRM|nr:response regulator transcription factor [Desulforamulus hydrothermalis]CCO08757.1 DNA-binding response regulator in two-component system with YedV [Desulforamulus hydrothermalis Lam5 = DSM 18033]SHG70747.1 two-component system, OmpR family, alkaline phosphatase synthesis response regulator PhoP [Desulforamulus hydrothermalis Lam5 = DSM 18033]
MPKILIVDDEQPIRELVKFNLEREGFQVLQAGDGNAAVALARSESPDLIVLDVMLPGQDGLAVCRSLHQDPATRSIPIIMLSARGEELDKVLGLEMGADDYITKPFSPRELVARVKARLRRQTAENQINEDAGRITAGKLIIDQERFIVSYNGIKQDLTPKEFELLRYLARNPGKVFTRDFLLEQIWGYDFAGDSRTVDVHIRHIRQKLEQISGAPQFIETVRGVGYRFKEA